MVESTPRVTLRFYQELNDFLPPGRRQRDFHHPWQAGSVKDLVESLGVPHTEIDLILANGRSVDFGYPVQAGDRISVYPVFEALDITPATRLRPRPLRCTRLVLDCHLGRLAAYLRMLGFDTLYRNDYDDATLAEISDREQRILLTCDRKLLMRKQVTRGYFVRSRRPREQLREVIRRLDLAHAFQPFTRCMVCNQLLEPVEKSRVLDQLPPHVRIHQDRFWQCRGCGKIYWKGTHYQRMLGWIEKLTDE
ncbi:MAG: Mut7-C ubiquitin/RNAse domain-containing protein [Sedimenticola sp.]|nr:Mut7-C ubiquitin/RNAse domain-containing protein [Sedimenticola sp.]